MTDLPLSTRLAAVALAVMACPAFASLAAADSYGDCGSKGAPALGTVTIGSGDAGSLTLYVDDRNYLFGNGVWIYQETNSEQGLQRGGSSNWYPGDLEICFDDSVNGPDQLIF